MIHPSLPSQVNNMLQITKLEAGVKAYAEKGG